MDKHKPTTARSYRELAELDAAGRPDATIGAGLHDQLLEARIAVLLAALDGHLDRELIAKLANSTTDTRPTTDKE